MFNLVHGLALGTPNFYIEPHSKINRRLVNLSYNFDLKSGLNLFNNYQQEVNVLYLYILNDFRHENTKPLISLNSQLYPCLGLSQTVNKHNQSYILNTSDFYKSLCYYNLQSLWGDKYMYAMSLIRVNGLFHETLCGSYSKKN